MNSAFKSSAAFQESRSTHLQRGGASVTAVYTGARIPEIKSRWFQNLSGRLNELTALPVGWDGYSGQPVSLQCANFVARMLERLCMDNVQPPYLVPGSDGSLQVEWHWNGYDVELDVLDAQNVIATRINRETQEEETVEIQSDFSEIIPWIRALADRDSITGQGN